MTFELRSPCWLSLLLATSACVGRSSLESHPDADGDDVFGDPNGINCSALTAVDVFVGVHGSDTARVRRFSYDLSTTLQPVGAALLPELVTINYGTGLRGIASHRDGVILAADVESADAPSPFVDAVSQDLGTVSPLRLLGAGARELANVHGLCTLTNGDIIAGELHGSSGVGAKVNEYDHQGHYVRDVFTSTLDSGVLSDCTATADGQTLFLADTMQSGSRSDVIRFDLIADTWSEVSRFIMSDFDGGAGTGGWAIALSGTSLYIAPTQWDAGPGRIDHLIRCPVSTFGASACTTVGDALPLTGGTFIEGMTPLPCSEDLLLDAIGGQIFRYDGINGGLTLLYDVSTDSPGFYAVRKLAVVPR